MTAINLAAELAPSDPHWSPRIVRGFNGHDLMEVMHREFVWHDHPGTDDFFTALAKELKIDLPDGTVALHPGEVFVVPKDVQHRPCATVETHLLLIEPAGTPNTGDPATAATKVRV